MTALNNILIVLLFLLVIAIVLFALQHYGVISFKVFPDTWFYIDGQLSNHLGDGESTAQPPAVQPPTIQPPSTVPPVDPTPPTTDEVFHPPSLGPPLVISSGPKYLGCYNDTVSEDRSKRVFPTFVGVMNLNNCNAEAKKVGSKYFGLQYLVDQGGVLLDTAQCWIDGQNTNRYDRDGKTAETNCPILGKATYARGGPSVNAVYETI